jgi:hypothetical protein
MINVSLKEKKKRETRKLKNEIKGQKSMPHQDEKKEYLQESFAQHQGGRDN